MRHVYAVCCSVVLILSLSCGPTMKDFSKLYDELRSSNEAIREQAAREMGEIRNADPIVFDALIDCGDNDKSSSVRSACVKSFFSSVGLNEAKDEATLQMLRHFMESASCREKKELYYLAKGGLPEGTRKEFESSYGSCIRAFNFCEYCGQPAVGWCTMRHKYVCSTHRYFTQGGVNWRCP